VADASERRTEDIEAVEKLGKARDILLREIHKIIIGQDQVIEHLLCCLFARGHALMIGVPGLAKTLMISTLARILKLRFHRIQFTPDLMPSDITGTQIIEEDQATGKRNFRFVKGPIFANIILADEINRTPPKTQAALLQSMQEYQVSSAGVIYDLELPFPSSSSPLRTPSSRRAPTPCPRLSSTALCSTSSWTTRHATRSGR